MPIYVYRCDRCEGRFERLVQMSANSATATCPSCGAGDARKQISTFAAPQKGTSTLAAGLALPPVAEAFAGESGRSWRRRLSCGVRRKER